MTSRDIEGVRHEVVTATSTAATRDDARNRAVTEAMAALQRFVSTRIKQDVRHLVAESQTTGPRGIETRSREESESLIVASSQGELKHARVLQAPPPTETPTGFAGAATVGCPTHLLFPHARLQSLLASGTATPQALIDLANAYDSEEGHAALAEESLRWACEKGGGAAASMALAQHLMRRGFEAEALRCYELAIRQAGEDSPLATEARARVTDIRDHLDTVASLTEELLRLAESRKDARFSVRGVRAARSDRIDWEVRWDITTPPERRVLKMWLDDSFTPVWFVEDESVMPGPSQARNGGVGFSLPRGSQPARVLLWALPVDSDLWPVLVAWRNTELRLEPGACPDEQRVKLRDVVQALRRTDVAAGVVNVSG